MRQKTLLSALIFLLFPLLLQGQTIMNEFMTYTHHEVFPSKVYDITEDSDGFLWLGTDNGLVRSDGKTFRCFASTTDGKHKVKEVRTLELISPTNDLLIGTPDGLFLYEGMTDGITRSSLLIKEPIRTIVRIDSTIYIGTSRAAYSYPLTEGKLPTRTGLNPIFTDTEITCCKKIQEDIYMGSMDQVCRISSDGIQSIIHLPALGSRRKNTVLDISENPYQQNLILIGTSQGLICYDSSTGASDLLLEGTTIRSICFCRNQLCIGTEEGLYILDSRDLSSHMTHLDGYNSTLPTNAIYKIYENSMNDIFLGTDIGLSRVNVSDDWTKYRISQHDGPVVYCNSMEYDHHNIYIGTQDGLLKVSEQQQDRYEQIFPKKSVGQEQQRIQNIKIQQDRMWITTDQGISLMNLQNGQTARLIFNLQNKTQPYAAVCHSAITDTFGRIWVATSRGVIILTEDADGTGATLEKTGKKYSMTRIINDKDITDILFKDDKAIAIGQGDVFITEIETLHTVSSLSGYQVRDMVATESQIYFSTRNGLYHFQDYTKLAAVGGMDNDIDHLCRINEKLYAICGQEIHEYKTGTNEWRTCSFTDSPVTSMTSYGTDKLLLGSLDCFYLLDIETAFNPEKNNPVPTITGLTIDNEDIPVMAGNDQLLPKKLRYMDEIVLPRDFNSFALSFTVPHFKNEKPFYFFRLKGYADTWYKTEASKATFSDIPAGKYTFEVRSSLSDDSGIVSLGIRVKPKWYSKAASKFIFTTLLLLAAATLIWYIRMRSRLKKAEREKTEAMTAIREKKNFLETFSYEMTAPLNTIVNELGNIATRPFCEMDTEQLHLLDINSEKIQTLLQKMTDMNDTSSRELFIPSPTNLNHLVQEVWQNYEPRMTQKNIQGTFTAEKLDYLFMVDRVKIKMALGHLLDNALKYTPANGSIRCSMTKIEHPDDTYEVRITLTDSGKGIAKAEIPLITNKYYTGKDLGENAGEGLGLWVADQTIRQHEGQLTCTSEEGKGSSFEIVLHTYKKASLEIRENSNESLAWQHFDVSWKHGRKPNILLISRDNKFKEALIRRLSVHMNLLAADNHEACMELAKNNLTDLIIYDFSSMEEAPADLWSQLRSWCNDPIIPLVGITDKNTPAPDQQLSVNSDAVLCKPVSMHQLVDSLIWSIIKHEKSLESIRREQLTSPQEEIVQSHEETFLKEMMDIIEANIDQPDFSVEKLCESSHYSSSQIYRNIKQICGMTVVEFIRDVRLKKAASYIRQGKLTVNEIMYLSGFTSRTYFYRRFKEKFGMSPTQYGEKFGKMD